MFCWCKSLEQAFICTCHVLYVILCRQHLRTRVGLPDNVIVVWTAHVSEGNGNWSEQGTTHSYSCNNIIPAVSKSDLLGKYHTWDRTVLIYSSEVTWGEAVPPGYQYHHCLFFLFSSLCWDTEKSWSMSCVSCVGKHSGVQTANYNNCRFYCRSNNNNKDTRYCQ